MKKEIRDRQRELFEQSMELRNLDLSQVKWEQAQEIRKKQDDDWHRHLFFKGYLEQLEKEKENEHKQIN